MYFSGDRNFGKLPKGHLKTCLSLCIRTGSSPNIRFGTDRMDQVDVGDRVTKVYREERSEICSRKDGNINDRRVEIAFVTRD